MKLKLEGLIVFVSGIAPDRPRRAKEAVEERMSRSEEYQRNLAEKIQSPDFHFPKTPFGATSVIIYENPLGEYEFTFGNQENGFTRIGETLVLKSSEVYSRKVAH